MNANRAGLFVLLCTSTLLLNACLESAQSPPTRAEIPAPADPGGSTLAPVDLVYVCGNKFLATNATRSPVEVTYRVLGADETGSLTLREGQGAATYVYRICEAGTTTCSNEATVVFE